MVRLWADELDTDSVNGDDDFFELGGSSLMAVRLVQRMSAEFGLPVTLADLFEVSTVNGVLDVLSLADDGDEQAGGPRAPMPLGGRDRPEVVPLSFAQVRMWLLNRLEGADGVYNVPLVLRLSGKVDREALLPAVKDVVERHEILRTFFPEVDGQPCQVVKNPEFVEELAFREVSEHELDEAVRRVAWRAFDLSVEAPLRPWLFTVSPTQQTLVLVLHHIVVDEWSVGPLIGDLSTAYQARRMGEAPEWEPLPVQYADYAIWQREWLDDKGGTESPVARQEAYWRRALAGVAERVTLPVDRPRPAAARYRGATVRSQVSPDAHRRLVEMCVRQRCTMFMALHAGVAALLSRHGAGVDVPIGTPVTNRGDAALNDLVGFFINTLVLRADLSGDPSFEDLLKRVRATDLAAFAHQDYPFERLVEVLNPVRSLSFHPLFQTMLVVEERPEVEIAGVDARLGSVDCPYAQFDLTFGCAPRFDDGEPAGIEITVEFDTDLFEMATAQMLADRLARLVETVAHDPGQRISRLDILTPAERHHLVVTLNDTKRDIGDALLPELFERQVRATPDAPAAEHGDARLNYAELNGRANRLAHLLIARGIGPEDTVGIALPRSLDLVVAVWAVLKAGAAYLPVDLGYPSERVAFMLADASPALLLTTTGVQPDDAGVPVLCLDTDEAVAAVAGQPDTDPTGADRRRPLSSDSPVYVLYTSGSTGRPKAVVMPTRAMTNLMAWHHATIGGEPRVRVAQFTAISFDPSAEEILASLLAGQTLVIPDEEIRRDAAAFARWLEERRIAELYAPNVMVDAVIAAAAEQGLGLPELRQIAQAGEPLILTPRLREFCGARPALRLHNLYGPTESHVVTAATLPAAPEDWPDQASIGGPIANTQVYVLDDRLALVPPGVTGELYLAGAGLARGYLNRPGLTAERFVADPFGPPGSRLYRTGDLARWRNDGCLEFLGRNDDQVKIRGFRIELAEVEAAVAACDGVGQAAATVHDAPAGGRRLVGYVACPARGPAPSPEAVRAAVASHLPDHMVPSAIVVLDELPLTPSGKVNRAALPAPRALPSGNGRAPRTPREEILCRLFAQALDLPDIGIDDDFFALGGHSLLAMRFIAGVRAELGAEITIRGMFEAPTVAGLAERLGAISSADPLDVLLPLRGDGDGPPLFCVHPGAGIGWVYAGLLQHLRHPVYAFQAPGLTSPEGLGLSVAELADDYVARLRSVRPHGPYNLLGWSFGGNVAHAMAVRLQAAGEKITLLAMMDSYPVEGVLQADPEPPGEEEAARAVLESVGHDPHDALVIDVDRMAALAKVFTANVAAMMRHRPDVFDGPVLFFAAMADRSGEVPPPHAWRPFVTGDIDIMEIPFAHGMMTRPEALARIGPALRTRLDALA